MHCDLSIGWAEVKFLNGDEVIRSVLVIDADAIVSECHPFLLPDLLPWAGEEGKNEVSWQI